MHVMTKYLDTHKATIAALEDYAAMQQIIETTDQKIKEESEHLYWFKTSNLDGMPRVRNPQAGEERMVAGLDRIDMYRQRYAQAREYMDWFLPAWNSLGEDDRFVLDTVFFAADMISQEDRMRAVADHFFVERDTAYRKKNRAVNRLAVALFGK